jgi:hypothetical protein
VGAIVGVNASAALAIPAKSAGNTPSGSKESRLKAFCGIMQRQPVKTAILKPRRTAEPERSTDLTRLASCDGGSNGMLMPAYVH